MRKTPTLVLSVVMFASIGVDAGAQQQFESIGLRHLPLDVDLSVRDIALTDVDGDLDLDLLSTISILNSAEIRLYEHGDPTVFEYANGAQPIAGSGVLAAMVDVDGDGDEDMITKGSESSASRVYRNDGGGAFTMIASLPGMGSRDIAAGDVDADGDLDLVLGRSWLGSTRLLLNNGAGLFTEVTATHMPVQNLNTTSVALFDADFDGDLDLFVGNSGYFIGHLYVPGPNELYLNSGNGVFTDVTAAQLPTMTPGETGDVAVGDCDGDGDPDLLLRDAGDLVLLRNDGLGNFTDDSADLDPAGDESGPAALWVDVDGDAALDIVLSGNPRILWNAGNGTFVDRSAPMLPTDLPLTEDVAAGDLDADGDIDLVFGSAGRHVMLLNGGGKFADASRQKLAPTDPRPMAVGDVDNDGFLDLVMSEPTGGPFAPPVVFFGDGDGNLGPRRAAFMPDDAELVAEPIVLADVDGDAFLDLIFIGFEDQPWSMHPRLYVNDGFGNFVFAPPGAMPVVSPARSLVAGDVDADGDVDLIVGMRPGVDRLYLNDGTGVFTDTPGRLPNLNRWTSALGLEDVDADGDLDLVVGFADYSNFLNQPRLYVNDGSGSFTDVTGSRMPGMNPLTNALRIGDVNGDLWPDIVLGCWGTSSFPNERHRLLLNDGIGGFLDATAASLPNQLSSTWDLVLEDLDADGDLDIFVGHYWDGDVLYLNDGTGVFSFTTGRTPTRQVSRHYAAADFDRDGDVDLVPNSELWTNHERQLRVERIARTGHDLVVSYHSQPGYGAGIDLVFPFVGFARSSVSLPPFGVLGLDPLAIATLPPLQITHPVGSADISISIPDQATLHGFELHFQAVVVAGLPSDARFTGVETVRVLVL